MIVEENGPGLMVYYNHKIPDKPGAELRRMRTYTGPNNTGTKPMLIMQLQIAVEQRHIIITDEFTYECMRAYSYVGDTTKTSAPRGQYDDPVMALAYAYHALTLRGGKMYVDDFGVASERQSIVPTAQAVDMFDVDNVEVPLVDVNPAFGLPHNWMYDIESGAKMLLKERWM